MAQNAQVLPWGTRAYLGRVGSFWAVNRPVRRAVSLMTSWPGAPVVFGVAPCVLTAQR